MQYVVKNWLNVYMLEMVFTISAVKPCTCMALAIWHIAQYLDTLIKRPP